MSTETEDTEFGEGLLEDTSSLEEKLSAGLGAEVDAPEPEVTDADTQEDDSVEQVSFGEYLKSQGLEYDGEDDFELAAKAVADAKRSKELMEKLSRYEQAEAARAVQPVQPTYQPTPQPQAPFIPQPVAEFMQKQQEMARMLDLFQRRPKSFDFSDRITYDENNNPKPVNPSDYTAVRELHEAAQWQREYNSNIAANLPQFVDYQVANSPVISHLVRQAVQQIVAQSTQEKFAPIEAERKAQEAWAKYEPKCIGADGQPTEYGKAFIGAVEKLKPRISDPEQLAQMADLVASQAASAAPVAPAVVTKAKQQLQLLKDRSKKQPSAGGAEQKPGRQPLTSKKAKSLHERMAEMMKL